MRLLVELPACRDQAEILGDAERDDLLANLVRRRSLASSGFLLSLLS